MAEAYILNGKGLQEIFGTTVIKNDAKDRESSDSFLEWAKRKPSLTINREDHSGELIDLSEPQMEAREFVLVCSMSANGKEDFFNKWNGLRTEFYGADTHQLYIAEHDKTYQVYFKEQRNVKSTNNINKDNVWIFFDIVLGERDPEENQDAVYLVDDQDRFLIT